MEKSKLNKGFVILNATSLLHYLMLEYSDCISCMTYYKSCIDVCIHVESPGLKAETIMNEISDSLLAGYSYEFYNNEALKYEVIHIKWRIGE